MAAPKVAAKKPRMAAARPSLPSASAAGMATCPRVSTDIDSGWNTVADVTISANASSPPSGNPTNTLIREVSRSLTVQRSSTAPEEKKNTSYGVSADANNATAKNQYVPQSSPAGGPGCATCCHN